MVGKLIGAKDFFKGLAKLKYQKQRRYMWTTLLATQYLAMSGRAQTLSDTPPIQHAPDIIIGGIPIWNINKIGHASSDEILKYRSMGGVFLAHQKGGKHTFKFTAHFFGPIRYILAKVLETILLLGTETTKKVDPLNSSIGLGVNKQGIFDKGLKASSAPLVRYADDKKFNEEEYMFHRTFPIITETKIYTDMYMETMVTRQSIKLGMESIEVTCAFRQFLAPTHFQKTSVRLPGEKVTKEYYRTFIPRTNLAWLSRIDHSINIIWATLQYQADMEWDKDHTWYEKQNGRLGWETANLAQTFATFAMLRLAKYGGR